MFFRIILAFILILNSIKMLEAEDRFKIAQLRLPSNVAFLEKNHVALLDLLIHLKRVSNVKVDSEVPILDVQDARLFSYPFLVCTSYGPIYLSENEKIILRRYLSSGGFLFVESMAQSKDAMHQVLSDLFAPVTWQAVGMNEAVFRSFYLIREVPGCFKTEFLEKLELQSRGVAIYSNNGILASWGKDEWGSYNYPCAESSRYVAQKMMVNIIFYALTGTYKTDPIHLPFIEEKLRR